MNEFAEHHEGLRQRREQELGGRTAHLPLVRRLDPVLLGLLAAAAVVLLVVLALLVWAFHSEDLFRPVPDERWLTNVRDDLATRPLRAGVLHDQELYVSQSGGALHRYDPATELWSTRRPFDAHPAVKSDLVELRSGCGVHRGADRPCADPETLWARSEKGALVRLSEGDWSVVFGETELVGVGGYRPETGDLTAAALSEDGRWLLVGTREHGVGLYDEERRVWVELGPELLAALPSPEVSHLRWWGDRFWIGGPAGLSQLEPTARELEVTRQQDVDSGVLDLEVGNGALWVLEGRDCHNNPLQPCLRLSRFTEPAGAQEVLIDEGNRYLPLQLEEIRFAQQEGDLLALAGRAGLHTYDARLHTWAQPTDQPILVARGVPEGGFLAAFPGGVLLFSGGEIVQQWPLDERVARLLPGRINEALALTVTSDIWSLRRGAPPVNVFHAASGTLDPKRFSQAYAVGEKVIFLGSRGGLVHDVRRRSYEELSRLQLPDWLLDSKTELTVSGDNLYAVLRPAGAQQQIRVSDPVALIGRASDKPGEVPSPVTAQEPWHNGGLALLAGDGGAYLATRKRIYPMTGAPAPELENLTWRDVVANEQMLAVATDQGLQIYRTADRGWGDRRLAGTALRQLADAGGVLRIRTADGQLAQAFGKDPILIGEKQRWEITGQGLRDARQEGGRIYLAGDGWIHRYHPGRRRLDDRWELPGAGAEEIRLTGVVRLGEKVLPLARAAGRAYLGGQVLDEDAGKVVGLSLGDLYVWTLRETPGQASRLYLKGYPRDLPFEPRSWVCFFRQSRGAGRLLAARPVGLRDAAVVTTRGLSLYDGATRSWYRVLDPQGSPLRGDRLALLGGELVLISESGSGALLTFLPLQQLAVKNGCGAPEVRVTTTSSEARAVAIDESSGNLAWIDPDGSVSLRVRGKNRQVLAASAGAPRQADLRRVFGFGEELFFTTDQAVYSYSLTNHRWKRAPVSLPGESSEPLRDLNLEKQDDGSLLLTATAESGAVYLAPFAAGEAPKLRQVLGPRSERQSAYRLAPEDLLDVQEYLGRWGFVLSDRLRTYDPERHEWIEEVRFPGPPDPSLELRRAGILDVLVKRGGREWWIEQRSVLPEKPRFALFEPRGDDVTTILDERSEVRRLKSDGSVEICRAKDARYTCRTSIPAAQPLDPDTVNAAYPTSKLLLLVGPDGTRAYERAGLQEEELPPQIAQITAVAQVRQIPGQGAWLRTRQGELYIFDEKERWGSFPGPRLRNLVASADGRAWVQSADGRWLRPTGRRFVDPVEKRPGLRVLPILDDQAVTGIGESGGLAQYRGDAFVDLGTLPPEVSPASVKTLLHFPRSGGWWLHRERSLTLLEKSDSGTSFRLADTVDLPGEAPEILLAKEGAGDDFFWVQLRNGPTLTIERKDGTFSTGGQDDLPLLPDQWIRDSWEQWRERVRPRPDGKPALDPVVALERDEKSNFVVARRPSGTTELTSRNVEFELRQHDALDAGWLAWQRGERAFRIATPEDEEPRTFSRQQAVDRGKLIFEDMQAVLARRGDELHVANHAGVWTFPSGSLDLEQKGVTFRPLALGEAVSAAHGRFLGANGSLPLGAVRFEPGGYPVHRERIGGRIVFRERTRERTVKGSLATEQGQELSAFAERGLRWDERRGIALLSRGRPFLLSAAGIHPLSISNPVATFDLGPRRNAHAEGRLRSKNATLYFHDGQAWHRRARAGWDPVDPAEMVDLVRIANSFWSWVPKGGGIDVTLASGHHAFALRAGSDSLSFTSDHLLAAAFHDGDLHVLSEAFQEVVPDAGTLASGDGERLPPVAADRLESIAPRSDGAAVLYRWHRGQVSRWDESSAGYTPVPADEDPDENRVLVAGERLRIHLRDGQVVQELQVDDPRGGAPSWKELTVSSRGFPFDRVTAVGAVDGKLLVHTEGGLQVYPAGGGTGLADVEALYDFGRGRRRLAPVEVTLGRPAGDPQRFVLTSGAGCFEWRSGRLEPCRGAVSLGERWRGETALWRWTQKGGRVFGRYKSAGRATPMEAEQLVGGRFPHDALRDVAACQRSSVSLWRNGWTSFHSGRGLDLQGARHSEVLAGKGTRRFLCVERSEEAAQPGLYAFARSGRFWRWDGASWQGVADDATRRVLRRQVDTPPILTRQRLRLRKRADLEFERRTAAGEWVALPWGSDGRVAVDALSDFEIVGETLWGVTPAGLTAFQRAPQGDVSLDPDSLTVVRELRAGQDLCAITDVEAREERVLIRCENDSDKVFSGRLEVGRDTDVFQPLLDEDPFAESRWVLQERTGYWDWRRVGRRGGQPGTLVAELHGEALRITDGRFSFDGLSSLAVEVPGRVDLATAGGWYQSPADTLHVRTLRRPGGSDFPPEQAHRITVTRQDGKRQICLVTASGEGHLLSDSAGGRGGARLRRDGGEVRECAEDLGTDALWHYAQLDEQLVVRSPGEAGGDVERELLQGRFTDHVVQGMPVTEPSSSRLVPTRAGVLRTDFEGRATAIYSPEGYPDLSPGKVPEALYLDRAGRPLYATPNGLYTLDTKTPVVTAQLGLPGSRVTAVEDGPRGFLHVRWESGEKTGWTLLDLEKLSPFAFNTVVVDASSWGRFKENLAAGGDPSPWFLFELQEKAVQVSQSGNTRELTPWSGSRHPIAVALWNRRLLLVERGEISELRLDLGIEELLDPAR